MQTKLSGPETFWYYLINIFTLGGLYFAKIAAKKALCELNADIIAHQYQPQQYVPPQQYPPQPPTAYPPQSPDQYQPRQTGTVPWTAPGSPSGPEQAR